MKKTNILILIVTLLLMTFTGLALENTTEVGLDMQQSVTRILSSIENQEIEFTFYDYMEDKPAEVDLTGCKVGIFNDENEQMKGEDFILEVKGNKVVFKYTSMSMGLFGVYDLRIVEVPSTMKLTENEDPQTIEVKKDNEIIKYNIRCGYFIVVNNERDLKSNEEHILDTIDFIKNTLNSYQDKFVKGFNLVNFINEQNPETEASILEASNNSVNKNGEIVDTNSFNSCTISFDIFRVNTGTYTTCEVFFSKDNKEVSFTLGSKTKFGVPIKVNATTMVPVKFAEELGATVKWDKKTSTATYILGDKIISITIGSKVAIVNGSEKILKEAPYINKESRTMVPVRMIATELGYNVYYSSDTEPIVIKK